MRAAHTLFLWIVDYAGLFPPARLPMDEVVRRFARHRYGESAWMLGRLVVPVPRLAELVEAIERVLPKPPDSPWTISAISSGDPAMDVTQLEEFSKRHAATGIVESLEMGPMAPELIPPLSFSLPGKLELFFEVPVGPETAEMLDAVHEGCAGAKFRTGGMKPDAFPRVRDLAQAIRGSLERSISFKATAGLHHPIRSSRPMDGRAGGRRAMMHGFLNVAAAAAFATAGRASVEEIETVLEETRASAFRFDEHGLEWNGIRADLETLDETRRLLFRSFGSCSFDEPVAGLLALGIR